MTSPHAAKRNNGAAKRNNVAAGRGTSYAVYAEDGELEDSGTDWSPLVRRLGAELDNAPESLSIIWP